MARRRFFGIVLVSSVILIPASPAFAQFLPNPVHIGDVMVVPDGIITPVDEVSLDVRLVSGNSPIGLIQPTQVQVTGNEIFVDLFAGSGFLRVPATEREIVPLGTFGRGTYFYEVTQNSPGIFQSPTSGAFHVVPEPSTVALIVVATPLLLFGLCSSNGRRELPEM